MADLYCDHGAYGLTTNRLGLDAPAWGVPQEGDGSTIDAATASSVFSIDLTSFTSNAGTFALFGSAAVSVGAAASGATLATQIAAAINGSSTVVANTAVFPGAPMIKNAFYARATGATLEIMCRIGTAMTNILGVVWAGTWTSSAPTAGTFSGGSGGCWGWFWNADLALGVSSSITPYSYGAFLAKPYAGTLPTANDNIYVRTGGGASKTITTTIAWAYNNIIHSPFSKNIVFDTNTKWISDSATGTLKLVIGVTKWDGSYKISVAGSLSGNVSTYTALRYGGFEIEYTGIAAGSAVLSISHYVYGASSLAFKNVIFRDSGLATTTCVLRAFIDGGQASNIASYDTCAYIVTYPRTTIRAGMAVTGAYKGQMHQQFYGCVFDFNISGVSDPGPLLNIFQNAESDLVIKNCSFIGYAPGYKLYTSVGTWPTAAALLNITVDGCSGLAMPSSYMGFPVATTFRRQETHQIIFSNVTDAISPGLRVENCRGVAEWVPNDPTPFPTLASSIPGSGAIWAMRLIWLQAVALSRALPYDAPPLRMYNQLASAIRTLTLRLFMPTTVAEGIVVGFGYMDVDGNARFETTETIASDATVWANAASYPSNAPRMMSIVTDYAVAANSEIVCVVQLIKPAVAASVSVYLDPEFTVA